MYAILTYPLDVIKTNRILQTSLSKEGADQIPREILALQEKGGLSRGLYRGFGAGFASAVLSGLNIRNEKASNAAFGIVLAFLFNPLQILNTQKQVMNQTIETKTYKEML